RAPAHPTASAPYSFPTSLSGVPSPRRRQRCRVGAVLELYLHPIPRQYTRRASLLAQLFHPPEKDIVVVRVMVGNRQALHAGHLRHLERLIITAVSPALFYFEFLRGV